MKFSAQKSSIIAHAQTTHRNRSCSDRVFFLKIHTGKSDNTQLLSWIDYRLVTMFDEVRPWSTVLCRRYVFYMNGAALGVRCACKESQNYICKILQIPESFFQRI